MSHKFRFGVQVSEATSARGVARQGARKLEDLGYSTLFMPDHFVDTQLAPMPAIAMAAAHTTTLRVGALVFDNDYKHPAILAKEMRDDRPALRRPARARHRRGLDEDRLRRARPPVRPAGGARRPARRGARRSSRGAWPASRSASRRALPRSPTTTSMPEAGAAAAPADPRRRRRPNGAATRRPRGRHRRHQPEPARRRGRPPTPRERESREQTDREDRVDPRGRGRALRRHRAPDPLLLRARSPTTAWASRPRSRPASASTPEEALGVGRRAASARSTEIIDQLHARREGWGVSYVVVGDDNYRRVRAGRRGARRHVARQASRGCSGIH